MEESPQKPIENPHRSQLNIKWLMVLVTGLAASLTWLTTIVPYTFHVNIPLAIALILPISIVRTMIDLGIPLFPLLSILFLVHCFFTLSRRFQLLTNDIFLVHFIASLAYGLAISSVDLAPGVFESHYSGFIFSILILAIAVSMEIAIWKSDSDSLWITSLVFLDCLLVLTFGIVMEISAGV